MKIIINNNEKYVLETDASNVGIEEVLKQNDRTIAYILEMLKGAEIDYSITERIALADCGQ